MSSPKGATTISSCFPQKMKSGVEWSGGSWEWGVMWGERREQGLIPAALASAAATTSCSCWNQMAYSFVKILQPMVGKVLSEFWAIHIQIMMISNLTISSMQLFLKQWFEGARPISGRRPNSAHVVENTLTIPKLDGQIREWFRTKVSSICVEAKGVC